MGRCHQFSLYLTLAFAWFITTTSLNAEIIKIGTWNVEHLGSPGRGLGGIGAGNLPLRSIAQLKEIASLIQNDLQVDLLALQEVAITGTIAGVNVSHPLEKIIAELGDEWSYTLASSSSESTEAYHNMHCAYLWNTQKVRLVTVFDFAFANEYVGQKRLFDRAPLVGYFQALQDGQDTNDFLLVNVHLTSGQNNDENHLVAMVAVEQNMNSHLKWEGIKESDRIILGDFNDNQFAKKEDGSPKYMDLLYKYMALKKFDGLVTEETGATRMDNNLSSIIDKILVNNSTKKHMQSMDVTKYMPPDSSMSGLAEWRRTYSDHFPLIFEMKVASKDDDVD